MYIFENTQEKEEFHTTLNNCLTAFSKTTKLNKKKSVKCGAREFMECRGEYRDHNRTDDGFLEKLDYKNYYIYKWFWNIVERGYYEPTSLEISYFSK